MFQASVEGSEASGSRSHFIAGRVFVYMIAADCLKHDTGQASTDRQKKKEYKKQF